MKIGVLLAILIASCQAIAADVTLSKAVTKASDGSDVPLEIVTPVGKGPFPPVLYIHAKRGFEAEDRTHMRELATQGFLVLAPDCKADVSSNAGHRNITLILNAMWKLV